MKHIHWLDEPEQHDYPAAFDYLELEFGEKHARKMVKKLRRAKVKFKKAKDIFRASKLTLAQADNRHVERNREKVEAGKSLSPILLVRGKPMIVADGFHRLSAIYLMSEDAVIPCKLV